MTEEAEPVQVIKIPPQMGGAGPKAWDRLAGQERDHRLLNYQLRSEIAPLLDQVRLCHMSPSMIGDCVSRFVRKVVNQWQRELNVEKLDDVKTKAVDMIEDKDG